MMSKSKIIFIAKFHDSYVIQRKFVPFGEIVQNVFHSRRPRFWYFIMKNKVKVSFRTTVFVKFQNLAIFTNGL